MTYDTEGTSRFEGWLVDRGQARHCAGHDDGTPGTHKLDAALDGAR